MFRATKGSGVTITTILRNNAIETRPGNKIHHLGEKRSACVHRAPDWKTRIGEDVTSRILDRVQGATKKNTSETLVLQRYAEIVPSVNRTAVRHDPTKKIICISYSDDLAVKFSNDCRAVMQADWYKRTFPQTQIDKTKNTETEF